MKFCERPWTHMYVIDADKGQVWPCPWGNEWMNLGNILEDDIEDLRNGGNVEKLRQSILEGSYKYCDGQKCTFLSNDQLPDLSQAEIDNIISVEAPYDFILAYDETCNHACPSCRNELFKGCEQYYKNVDLIGNKLLPYLNKARYIDASGRGEIFASEHILQTLEKIEPVRDDFTLSIETNAALFDEAHWKRLEKFGKYNLNVIATVNSFHDTTYRYLNGYANHVGQVLDNLTFISSLRKKGIINDFTISMITQEANFREMPEYVDRCLNEFGADHVRIRAIIRFGMDENEYWFKDVFNPAHPCYSEAIDILHLPIMQDERVWFWEGDYEKNRKATPMPLCRFKEYYDELWKLVKLEENGQLESILRKNLNEKKYVLYGADRIAEYIINKLDQYSIDKPQCVLDAYKNNDLCGIPIVRADNDMDKPDVDIIVNTVSFRKTEINKVLRRSGYVGKIVDVNELI